MLYRAAEAAEADKAAKATTGKHSLLASSSLCVCTSYCFIFHLDIFFLENKKFLFLFFSLLLLMFSYIFTYQPRIYTKLSYTHFLSIQSIYIVCIYIALALLFLFRFVVLYYVNILYIYMYIFFLFCILLFPPSRVEKQISRKQGYII